MQASVEYPRISGRLFNCSLNCALPTLMAQLQIIALESDITSSPHIQAFKELKTCFEQWYQLQEPLTFANFYTILATWTHSEQELILAPVLRQFMVLNCESIEQKKRIGNLIKFNNEFIEPSILAALQEVQLDIALSSEGRYLPLDASEANELFYQHFGLYFQVIENNRIQNPKPDSLDLQVVDAYLRTGHYELSDSPPNQTFEEAFKSEFLKNVYEQMTFDDSFVSTNSILASLIPYVSQHISDVLREKKSEIHAKDYLKKAKEMNLHDDSEEGKMSFAIILLTLMQNDPTTQEYASQQLEVLQKSVHERLDRVNILIDEILKNIEPSDASISSCSADFSDLAQYFNVAKISQVSLEKQISAEDYYQMALEYKLHGQSFSERMTLALILLNLMANEENQFAKTILSSTTSQHPNHDDKVTEADALFSAIEDELQVATKESNIKYLTKVEYQAILNKYQTSYTCWNIFLNFFGCQHTSGTYWALKSLENQAKIFEEDIIKVLKHEPASKDSAHTRRFLFWTHENTESYFKRESGTDQLLQELKNRFYR